MEQTCNMLGLLGCYCSLSSLVQVIIDLHVLQTSNTGQARYALCSLLKLISPSLVLLAALCTCQ